MKLPAALLASFLLLQAEGFAPFWGSQPFRKTTAAEPTTATQLNVVDPLSITASALLGAGLGSPAWAVVAFKKLTKQTKKEEPPASKDFGAALPGELKTIVEATQPEVDDRVKRMWMNRERMNTVGGAMASSRAAQAAIKKVTTAKTIAPGKAVPTTAKASKTSPAVAKGQSQPPRRKNIFADEPAAAPRGPPVPSPVSASFVADLSGSSTSKGSKSYSPSRWRPGQSVPKTGGSYLETMGTSSGAPTASAAPPLSTAALEPEIEKPQEKKSYSVSSSPWKASQTADSSIAGGGTQPAVSPPEVESTAPLPARDAYAVQPQAAPSAPFSFTSSIPPPSTIPSKSKGVKKSYSMTSWKKGQNVNRAVSSSYLMNMGDKPVAKPSSPVAPPIPSPASNTPSSESPEKSFSVTSWKSDSVVVEPAASTSSTKTDSIAPPFDLVPPHLTANFASTSSGGSDYMSSIGGGLSTGDSTPKKSYSVSSSSTWKLNSGMTASDAVADSFVPAPDSVPYSTPNALSPPDTGETTTIGSDDLSSVGGSPSSGGPKKSFSINGRANWKSSRSASAGFTGSTFIPGATTPRPAPSTIYPPFHENSSSASGSGSFVDSIGGVPKKAPPKKSYRMSSSLTWENKSGGTGYVSSSFTTVPASSPPNPASYRSPALVPSVSSVSDVSTSASSASDYMSQLSNSPRENRTAPKKNYDISGSPSWKIADSGKGTLRGASDVPGASIPVEASHSSTRAPTTKSAAATMPSHHSTASLRSSTDYVANIGSSSSTSGGGPKKSFRMSSWKPGDAVRDNPFGRSEACTPGMQESTATSYSTSSPVPAPNSSFPAGTNGSTAASGSKPKKSYSMSSWKPGDTVADRPVGSIADTRISSAFPPPTLFPEAPSGAPDANPLRCDHETGINGSRTKTTGPKKSYSMSKWKPGNQVNGATVATYSGPPYEASPAVVDASSSSQDYMASVGGPNVELKKSYAVSTWKPGIDVNGGFRDSASVPGGGANLNGDSPVREPSTSCSKHKSSTASSLIGAAPTIGSYSFASSEKNGDAMSSRSISLRAKPKERYTPVNGSQANDDFMSNIGGSPRGPKESYSMSNWKPGNSTPNPSRSFALQATLNSDYMSNLEGDSNRRSQGSGPPDVEGSDRESWKGPSESNSDPRFHNRVPDDSYPTIHDDQRQAPPSNFEQPGFGSMPGQNIPSNFEQPGFGSMPPQSSSLPGDSYPTASDNIGQSPPSHFEQPGFGSMPLQSSSLPGDSYSTAGEYGGQSPPSYFEQPGFGSLPGQNLPSNFEQPGFGSMPHPSSSLPSSFESPKFGGMSRPNPSGQAGFSSESVSNYKSSIGGRGDQPRGTVMSGLTPLSGEYDRTSAFAKQSGNPYTTEIGGRGDQPRGTVMSGLTPSSGVYDRTAAFGKSSDGRFTNVLGSSVGSPDADYISNVGSNYGEFQNDKKFAGQSNLKRPGFGGTSQDKSYDQVQGGSGVVPQGGLYQRGGQTGGSEYKSNVGGRGDHPRGTVMSGLTPSSGQYDRTAFYKKGNPFSNVLGSLDSDPMLSSSPSHLKQPGFGGTLQDNSYSPVSGGSGVVPPNRNYEYKSNIGGQSDASRGNIGMSNLIPPSGEYDRTTSSGIRRNPFVSEIGVSVGDPATDYLSNIGSNYGELDDEPRIPPRSVFRPPGF